MELPKAKLPPMMHMTIDNITQNVIHVNSQGPDARFTFVLERLVSHIHDFARETRLSTKEWEAGLEFLTAVGQACTDVRQEFILLSDILGLSLLVDSIDHPKPPNSTEGSVLGPFYSHEAKEMPNGNEISHDPEGEPCIVLCTIKDSHGAPIEGVKIDIWEADSTGRYDVQYDARKQPDGRCVLNSNQDGRFWFKAIKPVPYPVPHDGPVGKLLQKLHRHPYRPAHMHFMFEKVGYDHLITALYLLGDPYEKSDPVFGVKDSLIVDFHPADNTIAKDYNVKAGTPVLIHNFVLVSEKEASDLRDRTSLKALADLGRRAKLLDGLPVPDVD